MAVRVTASEVKSIIDTDLGDTTVDAYITSANYTVDQILGSNTTLSDDIKKEIERWLTAHFIAATQERQLEKAAAGSASATFQGETAMGLQSTLYGQQVILMDTTGRFASFSAGRKMASIHAVTSFDD